MGTGKKLETTLEFLERMTREAAERHEAEDLVRSSKTSLEVKGEKEEKGEEDKEKEGKKRKWESGVRISERYNEEDADITIISSDGISFKVHSLFLVRASYVHITPTMS
jgi:hypothetical protein